MNRPASRLARETSPYLLQHAHNPVDRYPWGQEAFAKARAEDKPILMSLRYANCHWCDVMEREEVAAISAPGFGLKTYRASCAIDVSAREHNGR